MAPARGGWLDWLPQETILFDGARLDRRTRIELGEGAGCLALEAVVLGRAAMGETVGRLAFSDRREIWRGDKPVSVEPLGLSDASLRAGSAGLDGALAFATIVLVDERPGDRLAPLRAVLDEPGVEAAASAFDGKLVLRMRAGEGWPLRRQIVRALAVLRAGRPLPRVWQM
jgi:urease accessory protein